MNQLQFGHHCIGFSVDQQEVMARNVLCLWTFKLALRDNSMKHLNLESIGMKPTEGHLLQTPVKPADLQNDKGYIWSYLPSVLLKSMSKGTKKHSLKHHMKSWGRLTLTTLLKGEMEYLIHWNYSKVRLRLCNKQVSIWQNGLAICLSLCKP